MFTAEFEKTAKTKSEVLQALKGIGKSTVEAGKGLAEGIKYHGKRSAEKIRKEGPAFKHAWKGFGHPESYKALASTATKLAPEAAVGYLGYRGIKKVFDPNQRNSATLAYY